MKNHDNYALVALYFHQAIPPPNEKDIDDTNVLPPSEKEKARFNIDYHTFNKFIYPYERTEEVFKIEKYFLEKNLVIRKKEFKNDLKNRLLVLNEDFDINTWEKESGLDFDFKEEACNNIKKATTYFKKVNRQFFKSKEYFYLTAIFKNFKAWEKLDWSSYYLCSEKDIQFVLDNLEVVTSYKTPTSIDPDLFYLRNKKQKPMPSRKELKELLDFKVGQNYFEIEEFRQLNDLKGNKIIQEFLSQKNKS